MTVYAMSSLEEAKEQAQSSHFPYLLVGGKTFHLFRELPRKWIGEDLPEYASITCSFDEDNELVVHELHLYEEHEYMFYNLTSRSQVAEKDGNPITICEIKKG